jgi:hypothetical protein
MSVISGDTTAGNIILKNGTDVVATIAKGTTDNARVDLCDVANNIVAKGNVVTIESSSAGDVRAEISYDIALEDVE